ncbi:MAG: MerR family transcriptional regulator [Acidobacteriota bacterium]
MMKHQPAYKLATVSRLTGFSPALLRAWERRYGFLEPGRSHGNQRLYSDDDLRLLQYVRGQLDLGRSIGEIALSGRKQLLAEARALEREDSGGASSLGVGTAGPAGLVSRSAAQELADCRRAIVEGALILNGVAINGAFDRAFGIVSPDLAIREVLEPCAREIGELWSSGQCSVAGEHLASSVFVHRLQKLIEMSRSPDPKASQVICAAFPDELHQVGALVLCYQLTRRGFLVSYLGQALPLEELERACEMAQPRAVYLSVTRQVLFLTHRPRLLELVARQAKKIRFFVGGSGIQSADEELEAAGARLWIAGRSATDLTNDFLP